MPETHPISPLGPVKLAVTIDDMLLFRGMRVHPDYPQIKNARAISAALKGHGVSDVYAFCNTAPAEDDAELLRVFDFWLEAGHHVANHTHHHASINWLSADAYIKDIERSEELIGSWIDMAPLRTFRYCMDMWGDTEEKRDAVGRFLKGSGYMPVPVSIGFHDVPWVTPHWRCLTKGDAEGLARVRDAYVETALHQLRLHAANARAVFGRDPVHIWLIHGTPVAADCLGRILDRFAEAGVEFVPLEEGLADPMNAVMPPRISPEFIHQVEKWALVRGVPADDPHPHVLQEAERLSPIAGESAEDVRKRMTGHMAAGTGAVIAPFPTTEYQR